MLDSKFEKIKSDKLRSVLHGTAFILLIHLILVGIAVLIARQTTSGRMLIWALIITGEVAGYAVVSRWQQQATGVRARRWFWTALIVGIVEAPIAFCFYKPAGLGIFLMNFLLAAYGLGISFLQLRKKT